MNSCNIEKLLVYYGHMKWFKFKNKKTTPKVGEFGCANKYDAYVKCIRIIESCKTLAQWNRVGTLHMLFDDIYDDEYLSRNILDVWAIFEPEGGWETDHQYVHKELIK